MHRSDWLVVRYRWLDYCVCARMGVCVCLRMLVCLSPSLCVCICVSVCVCERGLYAFCVTTLHRCGVAGRYEKIGRKFQRRPGAR